MAFSNNKFRSTVADVIEYDMPENYESHVHNMVKEIIQIKQNIPMTRISASIKQEFEIDFLYHCNVGEGHGLQSIEQIKRFLEVNDMSLDEGSQTLWVEKLQTINLKDAYSCLMSKGENENSEYFGMLEESILREIHMIILRKLPRNDRHTKAGVYSNNPRATQFCGETYFYQQPEDMHSAVSVLLDRFNSLFIQSKSKKEETDRLMSIFKSVAWLVFELLDLHPFSDGNGRLCRLLCSYVLSMYTPFPSPICSDSYNKFDFEKALVDARKSKLRRPYTLTFLLIQSNLTSWRKLVELCADSPAIPEPKASNNF